MIEPALGALAIFAFALVAGDSDSGRRPCAVNKVSRRPLVERFLVNTATVVMSNAVDFCHPEYGFREGSFLYR